MLYKMRKKEVFFVNEAQFFAPWRVIAEFADDSRLTFDGFTEEQARAAMEAAQNEHGDIAWWDHVTDVNYSDGQYYKTLRQPPTVHVVDFSGYDGPLDENGFPVGLPNEISEYMKQQGEPPTVPKIIFKENEPKEGNET